MGVAATPAAATGSPASERTRRKRPAIANEGGSRAFVPVSVGSRAAAPLARADDVTTVRAQVRHVSWIARPRLLPRSWGPATCASRPRDLETTWSAMRPRSHSSVHVNMIVNFNTHTLSNGILERTRRPPARPPRGQVVGSTRRVAGGFTMRPRYHGRCLLVRRIFGDTSPGFVILHFILPCKNAHVNDIKICTAFTIFAKSRTVFAKTRTVFAPYSHRIRIVFAFRKDLQRFRSMRKLVQNVFARIRTHSHTVTLDHIRSHL